MHGRGTPFSGRSRTVAVAPAKLVRVAYPPTENAASPERRDKAGEGHAAGGGPNPGLRARTMARRPLSRRRWREFARDVLAGVAGEQYGRAFQVVVVAEATQRRAFRQLIGADRCDEAFCHFRRKEPRRERIDRYAIAAPTTASDRVKFTTAPLLVW